MLEIVPEQNITQVPSSGDENTGNETRSPAAADENAYDAPSRANEIRTEQNTRRKRRSGNALSFRARTSVWTTLAVDHLDEDSEKANCALCSKRISVTSNSSSNIAQLVRYFGLRYYRFQIRYNFVPFSKSII